MVKALYFPIAHESSISNKHSQSNFYTPVIHHLQSLMIVLYMIHTILPSISENLHLASEKPGLYHGIPKRSTFD